MTRRPTTRMVRTVEAPPTLSRWARHACASFGLVARDGPASASQRGHQSRRDDAMVRSALASPPGSVVLLTGPSGSGKSSVLRGIGAYSAESVSTARLFDADYERPAPNTPVFDAVVDAASGSLARQKPGKSSASIGVREALSASGLAEPALWARASGVLSAGEAARLRLACVMVRARYGDTVVCDEFASNLDRAGAEALACTAARWARRAGVRLIAATAHEDMPGLLAPDLLIDTERGTVVEPSRACPPEPARRTVRIESGTIADYRALSSYHYLGGKPATVCRVLRAVRTTAHGELLAGVLVVSMPTLNGVWRRQAWPGRYEGGCKRAAARRMNEELRCISRVIVEPRSRGLGVASALVRAYLAAPMSPATEAIAAMGGVSPFFRAAGMTEYHLPRPAHDARLSDALAHRGLGLFDLLDVPSRRDALIARELSRWGQHARIRITEVDPLPAIARHAVCRLASRPRAYAAGGLDEDERGCIEDVASGAWGAGRGDAGG